MSLIFHYAPMSTAVMSHWALEELGVPYEKVKHDFRSGELKQADFLAINPNACVPVLVHDGTPIFESAAIAMYLGEMFGVAKGLYPEPGPRRGEAMKWIVWANVSLGGAVGRNQHASSERLPKEQHNAAAAAAAAAEVEKYFGILETALGDKQYLLGDKFSLADVHVASCVTYATFCGFDTKKWPTLEAWRARATNRPAFAASMQP